MKAHRVSDELRPDQRPHSMLPERRHGIEVLQRTAGNAAVTALMGGLGPAAGPARLVPSQRPGVEAVIVSRQVAPAAVAPTQQQQADHDAAVDRHRAQQQRFTALISAGLAETPGSTAELDRDALLRNACQWISSGRVETRILSPTHDSTTRVTGMRTYFDSKVAYPAVGGAYSVLPEPAADREHLIVAPPGFQGVTTNHIIEIVNPASRTDERLRTVLIHEVQHDLDQAGFGQPGGSTGAPGLTGSAQLQSAGLFNNYQTEFRAHWIETPEAGPADRYGSPAAPATNSRTATAPAPAGAAAPAPAPAATHFSNLRQENVFWHLVDNGYGFAEPYVNDAAFRAMVDGFDRPRGVNLVNSIRVRAVLDALGSCRPANRAGDAPVQAVIAAFDRLDSTDLVFLHSTDSDPFWDFAMDHLPAEVLRRLRFRASIPVEDYGPRPGPNAGTPT